MNILACYLEEASLPPEYSDAAFLLHTGWTEAEYLATSDELIHQMLDLINAESEARKMQASSS
jgi:hypothetical protein